MITTTESARRCWVGLEVWVRRGCALIVSAVAAYSSYEHRRGFAPPGGADPISAALWPLSVDGFCCWPRLRLLKRIYYASRRVVTVCGRRSVRHHRLAG